MNYFEPSDLATATRVLAERRDARVVAGGTDLVVGARSGKSALPDVLVSIHRLNELRSIEVVAGGLRIGALVTHGDLETSPQVAESWTGLSDAAALIGSPATRHVGTVGGNICNASPAQELGSPFLVFDASVELASARGMRSVAFSSFVVGPGRTAVEPGELLTAVYLPPMGGVGRSSSAYVRLEYRRAMEIAVVGAAAMLRRDSSGRCLDARIALTAVAPTCVRAHEAEDVLRAKRLDADLIHRAGDAAVAAARPINDVRASAEYRMAMVPVVARRALLRALER